MTTNPNSALLKNTAIWVRLFAILAMLIGLAVLWGWLFGITALKSVLPELVSMKPNPALGLFLAGLILLLQTLPLNGKTILSLKLVSIAAILLIGILTLGEYIYDWNTGIDQLLFHESADTPLTVHQGRMSILAAGCLALLGGALLLMELQYWLPLAQNLAFFTGLSVLLPIAGYLQGNIAFFPDSTSQMAIHAAFGFLFLSGGIFILASDMEIANTLQEGGNTKSANIFLFSESRFAVIAARIWNTFFPAEKHGSLRFYLLVIVLMGLALWVRLSIAPINAGLQYVTFFPAITLAAIAGGYRTGLFATLMGITFATIIFTPPYYSLSWTVLERSFWSNLVFLSDGLIISISIEAMHRYRQRYQQELKDAKESEAHELALNKELCEHIAQLKQTQRALQDSEARLRALFNTTAIAIVVINEQGLIEEFNPASKTIFGYSQAEVLGKNVSLLMPEPYCSHHERFLQNYLLTGQSKVIGFDREVSAKRKGGEIFPIELNVGEVILDNRQIFVGFIKDITERKQMEQTRLQFQAIVQSSDDAIISKSLEGIVTSWNHGAEKLFGYDANEMVGNSMLKLFPKDRKEEETVFLSKISQGQPVEHFETVRIRKDGTAIDVSVSLSPIYDNKGNIVGASKIVRDITLNKQLEKELVAAKQSAEAASRCKSEFLANMSHEIRTPMNAVIGLTRLVMETELSLKQQDYLSKIQNASQALLIILNDILDLSKIEAGRLDIEQIEFDPTVMLQSVCDLFIAKVEEKGLEFFLEVAPEIPLTVIGDPLRIQQVLSNLVSNAIKFTPQGEIHICMAVETRSDAGLLLRLSVRDTGIGISAASLENLFQSFSQADASITRKFGGTGLGLVISKKLVKLMGGEISMFSQLGRGSTFSFTLRCRKGQTYNWEHDSHCLKHSKVLVIDDQETSCSILRDILESWHLQVDTCLSAQAGLEKIYAADRDGKPFDLLLLDWKMEGMNGLDLTHELRQKEIQGELEYHPVIIMVTAHCKEQLQQEIANSPLQVDSILTKPVVPSSLLNTILHVYHYPIKDICQPPKTLVDPYQAALPLRNTRLLLVEDNELNQQVAGEFLTKAGLRVSTANHGGEAVEWLKKTAFDVVLMDLQMPEMDGFEATRQIRQLPNCQQLPIIAMTAAAMQNDRKDCLAAGMNDHVAKPIQPLELVNALLHWVKPVTVSVANILPCQQVQPTLPGFDLENIRILLANDEKKLIQMLIAFRERFANQAPAIAGKIKSGELKQAAKELHNLKGAAGNLGAKELYQATSALDAALLKGRCDLQTLEDWQKTFGKTLHSIATFTLQSEGESAQLSSVAIETLPQILEKLDALLMNDSFIDDELLMQLKNLLPNDRQTEYNRLNQLIVNTDYLQAHSVLNILRGLANGKS